MTADVEAHHDLHTRLAVAIAGETSDDAIDAMLLLVCKLVAKETRYLHTALSIVRGFSPDLEAVVWDLYRPKKNEADQ